MPDFSAIYPYITDAVALLIIATGLIGTVYPILPGPSLMLGGFWLLAWNDDYLHVGGITLVILAVLTVISLITDFVASAFGAKRVGASKLAVTGALVGSVIGIFFGIFGLLIGPFIGAATGEMIARGGLERATTVGLATWMGLLIGTIAKLAIGITMLGIFCFAWFVY